MKIGWRRNLWIQLVKQQSSFELVCFEIFILLRQIDSFKYLLCVCVINYNDYNNTCTFIYVHYITEMKSFVLIIWTYFTIQQGWKYSSFYLIWDLFWAPKTIVEIGPNLQRKFIFIPVQHIDIVKWFSIRIHIRWYIPSQFVKYCQIIVCFFNSIRKPNFGSLAWYRLRRSAVDGILHILWKSISA